MTALLQSAFLALAAAIIRAVRVNISLPECLVARIDEVAEARHLSRSAFLALAAQHEMAQSQ